MYLRAWTEDLPLLQSCSHLEGAEDEAGWKSHHAGKCKRTRRGSLRKEVLPRAQQDWIDRQQHYIRQALLQQRRGQRGTARKDMIRAALCLDTAKILDEVRSKAFERPPLQTLRMVSHDVLVAALGANEWAA